MTTLADKLRMAAEAGVELPHYTNTDNPIDFPKSSNTMNNRIDELFEQALDWAVPETWSAITHVQLSRIKEEYARLLIAECMDCAQWVGKMNTLPVEPIHTAMAINKRIMKRFDI